MNNGKKTYRYSDCEGNCLALFEADTREEAIKMFEDSIGTREGRFYLSEEVCSAMVTKPKVKNIVKLDK